MNEDPKYKIATLIRFKDDVQMERVMKWIKALEEKGVIDGHDTREYISNYGDPCWYIP